MSALASRTDTDQVIKAIFDVTPVVALTHEPAAGQPTEQASAYHDDLRRTVLCDPDRAGQS
jgi:hypothetical protein